MPSFIFAIVQGIAWATPVADLLALMVSAALLLPYLRALKSAPSRESAAG